MAVPSVPFWEEAYRKDDSDAFETQPNSILTGFERDYDLVMSFATLCFAPRDGWKRFLSDAKEHTRTGGIHLMHTFTDAVPASPDIAPFAVGLSREGELRELYSDWEILQFQSYVFDDRHPGVPKHQHAVNRIAARKPR